MDDEALLEDVEFDDEMWLESDDEAAFLESEWDDEAEDDEAEFLPGPLGLLTAPLTAPFQAIGSLLGGPRQPRRFGTPAVGGRGVSTAVLNTPRGSATLRLPTSVVSRAEFLRVTSTINGRLNTTQRDLHNVRQQAQAATAAVTAVRTDLSKYKKAVTRWRRRDQRTWRTALAKMRQEQQSQATMNLLMTMMMQRQIQDSIEDHSHAIPAPPTGVPLPTVTAAAGEVGDGNNALMFLPLMMMQPSGSDNSGMMFAMMAMAMSR